jgi:hypothetical protein
VPRDAAVRVASSSGEVSAGAVRAATIAAETRIGEVHVTAA